MKQFKQVAIFLWYGLGAYLTLSYIQWRLLPAWPGARDIVSWMAFAKACLGFVLLVGFFILIHLAIRGAIAGMPAMPPPAPPHAQDLSVAGLAGVGSLVGLFSKNAIEKLRELFDTLFSTKKGAEQSVLDRLRAELKRQVTAYLAGSGGESSRRSS